MSEGWLPTVKKNEPYCQRSLKIKKDNVQAFSNEKHLVQLKKARLGDCHNKELYNDIPVGRFVIVNRLWWAGHVLWIEQEKLPQQVMLYRHMVTRQGGRPKNRWLGPDWSWCNNYKGDPDCKTKVGRGVLGLSFSLKSLETLQIKMNIKL